MKIFLRAIRIHQWVKNILVFVPLAMAHQYEDIPSLLNGVAAFFSFCLCASAIYLINDLMDHESDRHHPTKKMRPIASGQISQKLAIGIIGVLLFASLFLSLELPRSFLVILGVYLVMSLAYSVYFKHVALIDVLILAGLYSTRLLGGARATEVPLSPWLLAFSMFFFLSLAFVKRFSELKALNGKDETSFRDRGYLSVDYQQLGQFGIASGYLSVLVLALYINSEEVVRLYQRPIALWVICPLMLYWLSRVWMITHRGKMHDDPIVFAIRDKVSYALGLLMVILLFVAGPK